MRMANAAKFTATSCSDNKRSCSAECDSCDFDFPIDRFARHNQKWRRAQCALEQIITGISSRKLLLFAICSMTREHIVCGQREREWLDQFQQNPVQMAAPKERNSFVFTHDWASSPTVDVSAIPKCSRRKKKRNQIVADCYSFFDIFFVRWFNRHQDVHCSSVYFDEIASIPSISDATFLYTRRRCAMKRRYVWPRPHDTFAKREQEERIAAFSSLFRFIGVVYLQLQPPDARDEKQTANGCCLLLSLPLYFSKRGYDVCDYARVCVVECRRRRRH